MLQIYATGTRRNFHFTRSIAICSMYNRPNGRIAQLIFLYTYGNETTKRISDPDWTNIAILKSPSETTDKKLRREADLNNDMVFAGLTSRVSSLVSCRLESWERDLRYPSMAPLMAKTFADVHSTFPTTRRFHDAASNTEFYRAWKARDALSVWKRFKLALQSLRFEEGEERKGEGRDEKRRDRRLAEYAIFTVSDGFLLRQSTDTLLVNVELLF